MVEDSNILLCPITPGASAINVEIQTSTQASKLIEQDYTLRLSLVTHEWATEHLRAWNAVFAEGRRRNNSGYFGPALVEMEIADTEKRADWVFQTCCEIWEAQGRTKCRHFFRAVFEAFLKPIFSMRESSFSHTLEIQEMRIGSSIKQELSVVVGQLNRDMSHLRAKWNTKLEIATRDNEYQQQRVRSRPSQQRSNPNAPLSAITTENLWRLPQDVAGEGKQSINSALMPLERIRTAALSFTWKELEGRFSKIQLKPPINKSVSAGFTRTEWDSGAVTEDWTMGGDLVCRTEFERLASIAAQKLGCANDQDAFKCWLERVREWLNRTGLDTEKGLTWRPTGDGIENGTYYKTSHLNTERIADLSAMFCMELMAQGARESPLPAVSNEQGSMTHPSTGGRAGPTKKQTKRQLIKMVAIFGALQTGLKALRYCVALDERRMRPPDLWIEDGCPSTYAQAYKESKWRKRIQDEKCRYRQRYEMASAKEREAIIQGENGTRRTRP